MKDYRARVKIVNNRLLTAIESSGYSSVNAFCTDQGFSPTAVGNYVNMKTSPILRNGDWSRTALSMATALKRHPDMLFSSRQRHNVLKSNAADAVFSEERLDHILQKDPTQLLEDRDMTSLVGSALGTLTGTERIVVEMRFGLEHGDEQSLDSVANSFGLSPERIRQIEAKALRKLRNTNDSERQTLHDNYKN